MKHIDDVTLSGTVESYIVDPGTGQKIQCEYQDPTDDQRRQLRNLEEKADNGNEDAAKELEELVVDDLFLSDKITTESGLAQKQAVIAGLFRGLGANEAVEDAQELFEQLNEGNR
jgi:hypothetical protein